MRPPFQKSCVRPWILCQHIIILLFSHFVEVFWLAQNLACYNSGKMTTRRYFYILYKVLHNSTSIWLFAPIPLYLIQWSTVVIFFFQKLEINVGDKVCRMRQNPQMPHLVATGGKGNDLKIWDLQNPTEPVFKAKNVSIYLSWLSSWIYLRVLDWNTTSLQIEPG